MASHAGATTREPMTASTARPRKRRSVRFPDAAVNGRSARSPSPESPAGAPDHAFRRLA